MKMDVITLENESAGSIELADGIFGLPVRRDILHRAVVWQLAKRREGNHKTKTRGEVRGRSGKMFRQKGTGRARHGNRKVPQFRGGAKAFGPQPRSHETGLPKKVRKLALKTALSAKREAGELVVLDKAEFEAGRTAAFAKALAALGWSSPLVIDGPEIDAGFRRAVGNLPRVDVLPSVGANVYDILNCGTLVLTKAAVSALEARLQ